MNILEARNIKKVYNPHSPEPINALRGVSLDLKKGEFVALMGRSGSGKSTLLHQLALLDRPTAGEIIINNKNVAYMSEKEKAKFRLEFIGYVFQDYALSSELTVFENVALPLLAAGFDSQSAKKSVSDVLQKLEIEKVSNHLPSEISGGQQQRVSIARAIVNKPKILFADEPTANLDSVASRFVLDALKELKEKYNQTILMVTHEPEDKKYTDRTIWLKDGLIEQEL